MAQFGRPASDITNPATWTGTFADIDEVSASDSDFGYSDDNTDGTYETKFSSLTDPVSSVDHIVRFRRSRVDTGVGGSTTGSAATVTVALYQGATLIRTIGTDLGTGAWNTSQITLTGTEADSITDYTDLRLRFDYTGGGGSPANRRGIGISWAEIEIPDATATVQGDSSITTDSTIVSDIEGRGDIASSVTTGSTTTAILGARVQGASSIA